MHFGTLSILGHRLFVDQTPNGWYDGHVEPNARVLGIFNPACEG